MDSTGLLAALLSGSRSADVASLIIMILLTTSTGRSMFQGSAKNRLTAKRCGAPLVVAGLNFIDAIAAILRPEELRGSTFRRPLI